MGSVFLDVYVYTVDGEEIEEGNGSENQRDGSDGKVSDVSGENEPTVVVARQPFVSFLLYLPAIVSTLAVVVYTSKERRQQRYGSLDLHTLERQSDPFSPSSGPTLSLSTATLLPYCQCNIAVVTFDRNLISFNIESRPP